MLFICSDSCNYFMKSVVVQDFLKERSMNITIRRARSEDIWGIYNVVKLAFEDYRRIGYREAAIQSALVSKSEIQRRINEEIMLIAEKDKQMWEL